MKRWMQIASVSLAMAIIACLPGCSSKSTSANSQSETINITGAGSTFVTPLMTRWIADYRQSHPNVEINYQSIGSGGGIQQLKKQLIDFGASDAALSDDQLKEMPGHVIQIAESAGPVCITYNLPELTKPLRLSSAAVSGIFLGTIKKWTDPAIAKSNPGVKLPNKDIVVAHRSDGSGTSNIFTTYLATVNPEWAKKVGKGLSVNWPVGLGGKGSEGVSGQIKQTPGGIGYVELSYATQNKLPSALIKNAAGEWVTPTLASVTAAAAGAVAKLPATTDYRISIVNPQGKAAYPIASFTWILIYKNQKDPAKGKQLVDFLKWAYTNGESVAASLDYAPLPSSMVSSLEQRLGTVQIGGQVAAK